ncbi:MAG: aspartyl protease family protein [Thermoplasmata archaeon]
MRFDLRILPDGRMELDAYAVCERTRKSGPVTFLVDTGASISSLGETDIRSLGLESRDLERYLGKPIVGIGGRSRTLLVRDVVTILASESGEEILPNHDFVFHKGTRSKKRRRSGVQAYERVDIFRAPSILGTDLLKKFGLILYYDPTRRVAYVEKR